MLLCRNYLSAPDLMWPRARKGQAYPMCPKGCKNKLNNIATKGQVSVLFGAASSQRGWPLLPEPSRALAWTLCGKKRCCREDSPQRVEVAQSVRNLREIAERCDAKATPGLDMTYWPQFKLTPAPESQGRREGVYVTRQMTTTAASSQTGATVRRTMSLTIKTTPNKIMFDNYPHVTLLKERSACTRSSWFFHSLLGYSLRRLLP